MWSSGLNSLLNENPFGPLGDGIMAADEGYSTVLSKRRKRSDNDQGGSYSTFSDSSMDTKLNRIFGELQVIRESQEQTNRGMKSFQDSFLCFGNKMAEVIDVTNRNTSVHRRSTSGSTFFFKYFLLLFPHFHQYCELS